MQMELLFQQLYVLIKIITFRCLVSFLPTYFEYDLCMLRVCVMPLLTCSRRVQQTGR